MRQEDVEQTIIELIAELKGKEPDVLLAEMLAAGPGLPMDSLDSVEILPALEDRLHVRLPTDLVTAKALRSARDLAHRVCTVATRAASAGRTTT
jgi:acyl carrier protein